MYTVTQLISKRGRIWTTGCKPFLPSHGCVPSDSASKWNLRWGRPRVMVIYSRAIRTKYLLPLSSRVIPNGFFQVMHCPWDILKDPVSWPSHERASEQFSEITMRKWVPDARRSARSHLCYCVTTDDLLAWTREMSSRTVIFGFLLHILHAFFPTKSYLTVSMGI